VLLVTNVGLLVTMDREGRVLSGTGIACADGHIVAIGPDGELRATYQEATLLDAGGGWVTPGLVNAHQHLTGDRLVRASIPDDLPPGAAIFEWAVPSHAAHTADDDELSALASCVEQLRNGITFVVEAGTVAHPERVAAGMRVAGIRGTVGTWGWDVDGVPFGAPAAEVLARQTAVLDAFPRGGDVEGWVTLVGHDLMSEELLVGASELARSRGVGLTFHQSPSGADARAWVARTGRRPLVHFDALGALGPHVLVAHGVHLDDAEVEVVLQTRTALAYCPWAYLRLGQGVTQAGRHAEVVERGGRVALGCDSENAADQLDILRAAALAAGLAKDVRVDPTRFGAREAFALATIRGAEAVGRGDDLGSLEVGKRADLVVHDVGGPTFNPAGSDPYLQLVWGTDGRTVLHVVVGGDVVVRDGRSTRVDESELAARIAEAARGLRSRAGLAGPAPAPPPISPRCAVLAYVDALGSGDADAVAALVTEDFVNEHTSLLGRSLQGRVAYRKRLRGFLSEFEGLRYEVEDVVVDGDRVVVPYTMAATVHGKPIRIRGMFRFRVRGGLVAHRVDYWDSAEFTRQLES